MPLRREHQAHPSSSSHFFHPISAIAAAAVAVVAAAAAAAVLLLLLLLLLVFITSVVTAAAAATLTAAAVYRSPVVFRYHHKRRSRWRRVDNTGNCCNGAPPISAPFADESGAPQLPAVLASLSPEEGEEGARGWRLPHTLLVHGVASNTVEVLVQQVG